MDQAQGALDTARAAGAAEYAAAEFTAAEAALARSHDAVGLRDYRQALNHALDALERAQTAARQAADEKALARTEADRALRTAEADLERVRDRLTAVTEAKAPPEVTAAARSALSTAESALASGREAFDRGAYRDVVAPLAELHGRLETAISEIDAAAATRPPGRPARRQP
jgi:hypothetical protein